MSRSNWDEFATPDPSHVGPEELLIDCDLSMRRRSTVPDPLAVLIAAESGRPILLPIFGLSGFTPGSPCPHRGPIREGSPHYCPVCHTTGLEDHPMIAGDAVEPPSPSAPAAATASVADPKIRQAPERKIRGTKATTRKERRRQQFHGERSADV